MIGCCCRVLLQGVVWQVGATGCCCRVMLQGVVAGCCLAGWCNRLLLHGDVAGCCRRVLLAGCSDSSLWQVAMQVSVAGFCGRVLW